MLFIISENNDPFFNLASEEFLLKEKKEDILIVWRNNPSVVIGKHQNTYAEIDLRFVREHDIKVVRRLSGGGAVYHDPGNLNFTLITRGQKDRLIDFKGFLRPVISFLNTLGINVVQNSRNDLLIAGKKIGGTAGHLYRNNAFHHGTLLFSSDLNMLYDALNAGRGKYSDKSIKSLTSQVANVCDHLSVAMTMPEFRDALINHFFSVYPRATIYGLSEDDKKIINQLALEKYRSHEWNFGYSPSYALKRTIRIDGGKIDILLEIERGFIRSCNITGSNTGNPNYSDIEKLFIGNTHDFETIRGIFQTISFDEYFPGIIMEDMLYGMF